MKILGKERKMRAKAVGRAALLFVVMVVAAVAIAVALYGYITDTTLMVVVSPVKVEYQLRQTLQWREFEECKLITQGTLSYFLISFVRTEEFYWLRIQPTKKPFGYVFRGSWPMVITLLR